MIKQYLNGAWSMSDTKGHREVPSTVPGSVYKTLLDNSLMDDPFWRDNEDQALALMDGEFEFSTRFIADADLFQQSVCELVFEGLDTLVNIILNDVILGRSGKVCRIESFYVVQRHSDNKVSLNIRPEVEKFCDCKVDYRLSVTAPDGVVSEYDTTDTLIENPKIWWPNGLGDQPLYNLTLQAIVGGEVVDSMTKRIGRTSL